MSVWPSLLCSLLIIFINKSANRFLIYSYFITSGIFLIILILWIVKRFGQLVELALYKLPVCYVMLCMLIVEFLLLSVQEDQLFYQIHKHNCFFLLVYMFLFG